MNRREAVFGGLVAGVTAPFVRASAPQESTQKSLRAGAWVSEWIGHDKAGSIYAEFTRPDARKGRPAGRMLAVVRCDAGVRVRYEARVSEGERGTDVLYRLVERVAPDWAEDWDSEHNVPVVYGRLVGVFDSKCVSS